MGTQIFQSSIFLLHKGFSFVPNKKLNNKGFLFNFSPLHTYINELKLEVIGADNKQFLTEQKIKRNGKRFWTEILQFRSDWNSARGFSGQNGSKGCEYIEKRCILICFQCELLGYTGFDCQRKYAHNSSNRENQLISFCNYQQQIFNHVMLNFNVVNFSLQIGLQKQNKKIFFSNQVVFVRCIE
ncbi:Hypothetical_protein [Hexamita inflata]|uniref:Hypothetical_protein n=1 Tax=Hexamita inflata TaxID=28002 RepID=A0AA86QLE8_9EUKA|nr:Hypothetical protein HINF_LOCUS42954 [Hexamita inflata]